jgi:hypothetical protein
MQPHVFLIGAIWFLIAACRQSAEPFSEQIDLQRGHTSQQNVQPQIKFNTINQKRIIDVLLHNKLFLAVEIRLFGKIDASSLAIAAGFDDVVRIFPAL